MANFSNFAAVGNCYKIKIIIKVGQIEVFRNVVGQDGHCMLYASSPEKVQAFVFVYKHCEQEGRNQTWNLFCLKRKAITLIHSDGHYLNKMTHSDMLGQVEFGEEVFRRNDAEFGRNFKILKTSIRCQFIWLWSIWCQFNGCDKSDSLVVINQMPIHWLWLIRCHLIYCDQSDAISLVVINQMPFLELWSITCQFIGIWFVPLVQENHFIGVVELFQNIKQYAKNNVTANVDTTKQACSNLSPYQDVKTNKFFAILPELLYNKFFTELLQILTILVASSSPSDYVQHAEKRAEKFSFNK